MTCSPRYVSYRTARLWAGAAMWTAGVLAGIAGRTVAGIVLRSAGIVLLSTTAVRKSSITMWTLLAVLAGVETGIDAPRMAIQVKLASDLFLRLIRMIVAPLLFATIVTGIASHHNLRAVGRIALKALICFEVITTLGMMIGAGAMNLAGAGWSVTLPAAARAPASPAENFQSWQQIALNLFPENIAQATAQNQILQIVVFSFLFGAALAMLPQAKRDPLVSFLQAIADAMFQLTRIVMYLAPIAAGAAIAYTVGSLGLASLIPLGKLVLIFYCALAVFLFLVLIPLLFAFGIPLRQFAAAVAEPAAIGFATTASEAALPIAMERMEEFGLPRWIVSFVIPAGYSFNMTGTSVYLSMAAIFAAQATGMHLSLSQEAGMLAILMLTSKGVTGVPRAVLVVLLSTASILHISTAAILLMLGVDAIMDMGRTLMNVIGNCVACAIVAQWEGALIVGDVGKAEKTSLRE